jgi:hypothetical protein
VEWWFAELTNKKLRRGVHRSVEDLEADITDWIKDWNENPRPFVWHKTADEILASLARYWPTDHELGTLGTGRELRDLLGERLPGTARLTAEPAALVPEPLQPALCVRARADR